jgi:hypothetical protein
MFSVAGIPPKSLACFSTTLVDRSEDKEITGFDSDFLSFDSTQEQGFQDLCGLLSSTKIRGAAGNTMLQAV